METNTKLIMDNLYKFKIENMIQKNFLKHGKRGNNHENFIKRQNNI